MRSCAKREGCSDLAELGLRVPRPVTGGPIEIVIEGAAMRGGHGTGSAVPALLCLLEPHSTCLAVLHSAIQRDGHKPRLCCVLSEPARR